MREARLILGSMIGRLAWRWEEDILHRNLRPNKSPDEIEQQGVKWLRLYAVDVRRLVGVSHRSPSRDKKKNPQSSRSVNPQLFEVVARTFPARCKARAVQIHSLPPARRSRSDRKRFGNAVAPFALSKITRQITDERLGRRAVSVLGLFLQLANPSQFSTPLRSLLTNRSNLTEVSLSPSASV